MLESKLIEFKSIAYINKIETQSILPTIKYQYQYVTITLQREDLKWKEHT